MRGTLLVFAGLLLVGCSNQMGAKSKSLDLTSSADTKTVEQIDNEGTQIRKVLEPCDKLFGVETEAAKERAEHAWLLKVVGVTSASIIAPALTAANAAANATWIAAASGTGGAVVASLDSADSMGISGPAALRGLTRLATDISPDVDIADDIAKPIADRSAAAARAARKCRYYTPDLSGGT